MAAETMIGRAGRKYDWFCLACKVSSGSELFRLRRDASRSLAEHQASRGHRANQQAGERP